MSHFIEAVHIGERSVVIVVVSFCNYAIDFYAHTHTHFSYSHIDIETMPLIHSILVTLSESLEDFTILFSYFFFASVVWFD